MRSSHVVVVSCLLASASAINAFADAKPNDDALAALGQAFSDCERALGASEAERVDIYDSYVERRQKAVAKDAGVVNYTGSAWRYAVPEWNKKCDDLGKKIEKQRAGDKANTAMQSAFRSCKAALRPEGSDREAQATAYKKSRDQAIALDPAVTGRKLMSDDLTAKEWIAKCDTEIAQTFKQWKKEAADIDKAQQDQGAKADKEMHDAEAKDAKETARVRKSLKGDRRSVFDDQGLPDEFSGKLEKASVWTYRRHIEATDTWCNLSYRFSGDKLVKKSKSGQDCNRSD